MRPCLHARWLLVALALAPGSGAAADGRSPALRKCEAVLDRSPASDEGYLCLFALGPGASPSVQSFLDRRLRARPEDPYALLYQGLHRSFAGEYVPEAQYARAVDLFRRSPDPAGLVAALLSRLGQRCMSESRCDETSLQLVEEAEQVAECGDDLHLRRLAQLWWLRWSTKTDDLAKAERALERLDRLGGEDPRWMRSLLHAQRAFLAGMLGANERRLAVLTELLDLAEPGSPLRATTLAGQAAAATDLTLHGRFDRGDAERLLRAALREQDRLGLEVAISDVAAGALATRVELALLLGPSGEGRRLLTEALEGYRRRKGWSYPWYAEWLMARDLAEGPAPRSAEALALADAALARAEAGDNAWEVAHSLLLRAWVRWRSGEPARAREDALAALERLGTLRRAQTDVRTRMRYQDAQAFAYELVAGQLLAAAAPDPGRAQVVEALVTMERFRAQALLEELVRPETRPADASEDAIRAVHRTLLDPTVSRAERCELVPRLRRMERQRTLDRQPEVAPEPPSVEALQAALRPDEALVSFQQWSSVPELRAPYPEGPSWVVVLTREQVRAVPIPGAAELEAPVSLWLSLLERRDGSDAEGGAILYERLFAPVARLLPPGIHSLVVVPDGILHRLPLEALRVGAGGPFLADTYRVAVVPSGAVWLRLRTGRRGGGGGTLAVADPVLPEAMRQDLSRAGVHGELGLPGSRSEAARALERAPGSRVLLSGEDATEERFKRAAAAPYSVIHLATHAVLDLGDPERSAVLLRPEGAEDGRLTVGEISRLGLGGTTVVLSACRASGGVVLRGEGTLSLARAFFEAGASTVVASLQSVRDDESAQLFEVFYAHLDRGESVGRALASAKRARREAGAPPASWAPYLLLGDSEVVPRPEGPWARGRWIVAALLGAVLVGAGARAWSRARSPES